MKLTIKAAKAELSKHGISLHKIAGEFKVYPKSTIGHAYFTDSLEDALGTGRCMARGHNAVCTCGEGNDLSLTHCTTCAIYIADNANADPIAAEIANFPPTFGLRAYPGDVFRISRTASYFSDYPALGTLYLYTQVRRGDQWLDFCKGTSAELRAQIVANCSICGNEAKLNAAKICSVCVDAQKRHDGAVCSECGSTVSEGEYSLGESLCCTAEVIPQDEYGKEEIQ
jgi:hypothetical protein